jgi:V8-like Glu-specific endopeptidase
MKLTMPVLLACLVMGTPVLAADKPRAAFKPAQMPALQENQANLGALAAPQAPMQAYVPPPGQSPAAILEGLSAIKGSPDGTQTEIGVPRKVKRMLLRRQEGMIGGTGGTGDDKDKKKKGGLRQIANTGEYPYTTVGLIASGCTGTVVMKKFVLTAAWCVYDLKARKFYPNLNFYPAVNGKKAPFGEVAWKNVWVAKGFAEKGDLNFGYALIELDQDVGDTVGWFGFGDAPNTKQFTLTGYPLAGVPAQTMWETRCPVQGVEESAIFYSCAGDPKALTAMLGSPVWIKGKTDDSWQIAGIHVTAQNDKMTGWWAARLSKAHTDTILAWAAGADQTDQGTDEDQGTDDQAVDDEGTDGQVTDDENGNDNPPCTCDDQANPQ